MLQIIYVHVRISAFIPNLRFEKKLEDEFEFEKTFILVAQFGEKNSNLMRNLRFEKISALVAPRPGQ